MTMRSGQVAKALFPADESKFEKFSELVRQKDVWTRGELTLALGLDSDDEAWEFLVQFVRRGRMGWRVLQQAEVSAWGRRGKPDVIRVFLIDQ